MTVRLCKTYPWQCCVGSFVGYRGSNNVELPCRICKPCGHELLPLHGNAAAAAPIAGGGQNAAAPLVRLELGPILLH